jgi:hypothetical protein
MLAFWVSWKMGHIKVGRGGIVEEHLIMQWADPEPMAVGIVSISTGWEATGIWRFTNFESNKTVFFSFIL